MTLQVLVSTMNQSDYLLINKMNIQTDVVVVNQCDKEGQKELEVNGIRVLWIDSKERGLSKSRNLAMQNATADICLVADDDLVYRVDYAENVVKAFEENPDSDLISFSVCGIEKEFKRYAQKPHNVGYLKSMKISSVEVAFKRDSFIKNNIFFDELIGAGTEFKMGEENSLLFSCLRKGFKIRFEPKEIADLHIGESTWFNGYNRDYFVGIGAAFTSMSYSLSNLLILQFAIRKYKMYKNDCSFFETLKWMNNGKKKYKRKGT